MFYDEIRMEREDSGTFSQPLHTIAYRTDLQAWSSWSHSSFLEILSSFLIPVTMNGNRQNQTIDQEILGVHSGIINQI